MCFSVAAHPIARARRLTSNEVFACNNPHSRAAVSLPIARERRRLAEPTMYLLKGFDLRTAACGGPGAFENIELARGCDPPSEACDGIGSLLDVRARTLADAARSRGSQLFTCQGGVRTRASRPDNGPLRSSLRWEDESTTPAVPVNRP